MTRDHLLTISTGILDFHVFVHHAGIAQSQGVSRAVAGVV
jgi:hypothetical protein